MCSTKALLLGVLFSTLLAGCVEQPLLRPVDPPAPSVRFVSTPMPAQTAQSRAPRRRGKANASASLWQQLPEWENSALLPSWQAFRHSCRSLVNHPAWRDVCLAAEQLQQPDNAQVRAFFEQSFEPHRLGSRTGTGTITGYYEPKLLGSPQKTARFRYPLYANPTKQEDPSYRRASLSSRQSIQTGKLAGLELYWVDNEVDLFFMQIQGSGRIELPNGQLIRVGHDGSNGRPYRSIGQQLINMGELPLHQASLWEIKAWGARNPSAMSRLMQRNPRFVYFRQLPNEATAPVGALGVPLTEGYSLAVDPSHIPLGAPVFLSTTYPNSKQPLNRLMVAQDTGCAIKGPLRADFFWGYGPQAETQAARMKQEGKMWVLLPRKTERSRLHTAQHEDPASTGL